MDSSQPGAHEPQRQRRSVQLPMNHVVILKHKLCPKYSNVNLLIWKLLKWLRGFVASYKANSKAEGKETTRP